MLGDVSTTAISTPTVMAIAQIESPMIAASRFITLFISEQLPSLYRAIHILEDDCFSICHIMKRRLEEIFDTTMNFIV
jgi:hypothetical protein